MAGVEMRFELRGIEGTVTHGPSGAVLRTVPPRDNGGDGSSFSPTDLLGASLASCALTTMALLAAKEGLTFGDASATVVKHMVGPPRLVMANETSLGETTTKEKARSRPAPPQVAE